MKENGTRLPDAAIMGFNKPYEAIEYAKAYRISLAILDIELGTASGLDLCRALLEINPGTKVVYLTAFPDYALSAWDTGALGFMVKPLTLQPIVENAVKHGMDPDADPLRIIFLFSVNAC